MNFKNFLLILTFLLFLTFSFATEADFHNKSTYKSVSVKPNDTLWQIILTHHPDIKSKDLRLILEKTIKINNLTYNSIIYPGQIIKIPTS